MAAPRSRGGVPPRSPGTTSCPGRGSPPSPPGGRRYPLPPLGHPGMRRRLCHWWTRATRAGLRARSSWQSVSACSTPKVQAITERRCNVRRLSAHATALACHALWQGIASDFEPLLASEQAAAPLVLQVAEGAHARDGSQSRRKQVRGLGGLPTSCTLAYGHQPPHLAF